MMKKIVILALLATSFMRADATNLYLKIEGGGATGEKISTNVKSVTGQQFKTTNTLASAFISGAIGADFILGFSGDLSYTYFPLSGSGKQQNPDSFTNFKLGYKYKAQSLMANLYYDLIDIKAAKIFIDSGLGYAEIEENFDKNFSQKTLLTNSSESSTYTKSTRNLAYSIGIGANVSLMTNFGVLVGYRHYNLGSTGSLLDNNGTQIGKNSFKFNSAYIGLKFNL